MPSIHTHKSMKKAREMGAFAGDAAALPLWEMSKRELVEVVIRLGGLAAGKADSPKAGIDAAIQEANALRLAGII